MDADLLERRRRGLEDLRRLPSQIRTVVEAAISEGPGGPAQEYLASRLYDLSLIACPAGRSSESTALSEPTWAPFVDVIVAAWEVVGVDAARRLEGTEWWRLNPCLPPSSQGRRVNAAINDAVERMQRG